MIKMTGRPAVQLTEVFCTLSTAGGIKALLRDIHLSVMHGEWLGIAGTNGSGKSTLAKVIANLMPASSGKIEYSRTPATASQDSSTVRPFVQMVFQNPDAQMLGETVFQDVCFGLDNFGFDHATKHHLAMQALEAAGMAALAHAPASALSGGQKQLVHTAGCIAVQPELLIFDEATAMLDPMSRQQLLRTVRRLHEAGTTILWITQLMDELAECDRIVALDGGHIVFDGSKEAFFYGAQREADAGFREAAVCDALGFSAPYAVQVARELLRHGAALASLPFTLEQLGKAVDL